MAVFWVARVKDCPIEECPAASAVGQRARTNLGTMSWQQALARTVTGLGYDLVDVERSAGGLLRVTIDRLPGQHYATGAGEFVLVEDCELVTRQLQLLLEVEAVDYQRLEVSSPGLDRPLKTPAQWHRFVGQAVEVTLREPFQNQRKWRGTLATGADDQAWRLELTDDKPLSRTASKRLAKAVAAGVAPPPQGQQVLDFGLDEVREARLVPQIDFKGRRDAPAEGMQEQAAQAQAAQQRHDGPRPALHTQDETHDGGQD